MQFITVKVAQLNGVSKEVTLSPGASVSDAVSAAGMEIGSKHVTVNGSDASASSTVSDGQLVMLATGAKGA